MTIRLEPGTILREYKVTNLKFSKEYLIGWLIRRDMPQVLDIEFDSYENPLSEEDFLCCLRQRNCVGMAAVDESQVMGFMIYEMHKSALQILNFAVHSDFRRKEIGTSLVEVLKDKLSQQRRQEIRLELRETNLPAQLFFRSQGFRATNVLRDHYQDATDDAYIMRYKLGETTSGSGDIFVPKNRISQYDPKIFFESLEKMLHPL